MQSRRDRLCGLLRQAVHQVRTAVGNLPDLQSSRVYLVPHGATALATRKTLPEIVDRRRVKSVGAEIRLAEPTAVLRASPEPCGIGVLPLAVRARGGAD